MVLFSRVSEASPESCNMNVASIREALLSQRKISIIISISFINHVE